MKKIIVFALMCILCFVAIHAQPSLSNKEVVSIISMSKEANMLNGIMDPNIIEKGQKLTFLFENGATAGIIVEDGDSQWKILKNKISKLQEIHGPVVKYVDPTPETVEGENSQSTVIADPAVEESGFWGSLPWKWILAIVGCIAVLYFLFKFLNVRNFRNYMASRSNSHRNNAATDNPMCPGGVSPADASSYMDRVAARANVTRFGPITEGRLTTFYKVRVMFANGGRKQRINNELVHHSRARRNTDSSECDIFYKQICGNDACEIDMNRASFVPTAIQPEALRSSQAPTTETGVPTTITTTDVIQWESLAAIVAAMATPMNNKDNGKLEVEVGQVKMKMEFSSSAKTQSLLLNGQAPIKESMPADQKSS